MLGQKTQERDITVTTLVIVVMILTCFFSQSTMNSSVYQGILESKVRSWTVDPKNINKSRRGQVSGMIRDKGTI